MALVLSERPDHWLLGAVGQCTRQQLHPCFHIHGRVRHDLCGSSGGGRLGRRRFQHVPQSLRLLGLRLGFLLVRTRVHWSALHLPVSIFCLQRLHEQGMLRVPSPGYIVSMHVQDSFVCRHIYCAVGSPKEHVAHEVVVTSGTCADLN